MTVRMKDIAKDLNVSVVTVSKVIRNHGDISPATRKRVLKRAKELNYQPNWIARSLVTRRTYIIGLVVPDLMNSFFAEVAAGVAQAVRPSGYHVLISNIEQNPDLEAREIELLLARQVDGLIVASSQAKAQMDTFKRIGERKPYILIDRMFPGLDANFVGVHDEEVGKLATEHLIEQGCRRIAHIRGPEITPGIGRLTGYRKALAAHGIPALPRYVARGEDVASTGYKAMRALLQMTPRPDGVFCFNDPVAVGAIRAILEAGLTVPNDIAVIGAGNNQYSDLLRVPLSTIDQSSSLIGEKAAELLLERIAAKRRQRPKKIFVPAKLIVRGSSLRQSSHPASPALSELKQYRQR